MSTGEILVTGGTGFIGSHCCVSLMKQGYRVVVVDNLSNSDAGVIDRIASITGSRPAFYIADVRNADEMDRVLRRHDISAAIHFAGLKAVGESVAVPLRYFDNNVGGTIALCQVLNTHGIKRLIFSSSATVYGAPDRVPVAEDAPLRPASPYGHSKAMVEQILADLSHADPEWRIGILRYFNPAGAHESGLIGESPRGTPNNLVPFLAQVAAGQRDALNIFGNDYPTPDGTGIRDYIHVMDLAEGHCAALEALLQGQPGFTVNLGSGRGHSVLDVVRAFEAACGHAIPCHHAPRRAGDVAEYYADPSRAMTLLGWESRRDLESICRDAWHSQCRQSNGASQR
ncbi:UDP-glucose 4-epimerase GalE [Denitratisoma sp. DHT3]|uniref:UDP-glucose 4-epimerase GalE n=1 Tax=Denitratisoma sp. DHT3 TaxID=1981880 RepID=UPI0011988AE7|nr:UDP-glucose 4-epimerase GalE [Denitratisoma sp. DHT3]QDX80068.1 UDP-glucose 4-epimerase GalE [Denitratisoma sp. DHT3]